jgi:putative spermidine/putrescine transport system permease protein
MIAGAIIAFFTSFDELTVALFLMTGEETLPMRLWANMKLDISPVIAPIATILIVVTIICLLFAEFIRGRASEATR